MKLLLVTQHFAPEFEGGTEFVARAQARALADRGHEVRVLSGSDAGFSDEEGDGRRREVVDGLPVTFLPRLASEPYDLLLERPRLEALLDEELAGADRVHVHHWSTLSGSLVRRAAARVPTFVTLHDLFTTCPRFFRVPQHGVPRCPGAGDVEPCVACVRADAPGWSDDALRDGLVRRSRGFREELAAAAAVIVPSRAHAERLAPLLERDAESLHVVPHGLCADLGPVEPERPAALAWTGSGADRLRILFLGHRSAFKGTGDLVDALAGLPANARARVELHFLGAEVEAGFDDDLRARAGDVALHFGGAYAPHELAERVRAAGGMHLAALPSRVAESYGLVLDEALALGLPAWIADRGAPQERIGMAGRVLPAEDPAAWRAAVEEVLDAPDMLERERLGVPGSLRTAADAAAELDRLYRDVPRLPES